MFAGDYKQGLLEKIRGTYVVDLQASLEKKLKLYGEIQELLGCIDQSKNLYASDVKNFSLYLGSKSAENGIFYFAIIDDGSSRDKYPDVRENTIVISDETQAGHYNELFDNFIKLAGLEDQVLKQDKKSYTSKSYRQYVELKDSDIVNKVIHAINKVSNEPSILV